MKSPQTRLAPLLPLLAALSACNAQERPSAPPPATGPALAIARDPASPVASASAATSQSVPVGSQLGPASAPAAGLIAPAVPALPLASASDTLPNLPSRSATPSASVPPSALGPTNAPESAIAEAPASAQSSQTAMLPPSPSLHVPPGHYVVAAIGDSLTDVRSHGGGYLQYLKTRCPTLEVDNFGKGATMVNQMRRSFDEQVAISPKRYTHLVIFGGVNDLYSDLTAFRTPPKIEADLEHMYAWGRAHQVKVVALTVAPWGGFKRYFNPSRGAATRTLNAWIREQPKTGHVDYVIDAYALLSCGDPERLCDRFVQPFKDGLHFGPEGHERLGQALFRQVFSDCE